MNKNLSKIAVLATLVIAAGVAPMLGQNTPAAASAPAVSSAQASAAGSVLDRVVAVVNGDVVLESDVEEEQRFAVFQPLSQPANDASRVRAVERLINRALILQQLKIQPQAPVSDKELDDQLMQLRKELPACRMEHCETDAGWQSFVSAHGFTVDEVRERWKKRMEVLRFIEQRFRMGVRVAPEEIQSYYEKTLLPLYAAQKAPAPKLGTISDRIQEVLLQQQVSSLLSDWLKSLRAQGTVRIVGQDEASGR
ncbi:MAG: hypothetical protein NVSMB3_03680 [Acidobacteriaceae bacterium]